MDTILIASRNPAKIQRYREILVQDCQVVIGLDDVLAVGKPAESGATAEENAEIKARYYASCTGQLVFAEDEALYVDFLPAEQQPGVHVRRVGGIEEASDAQLLTHWERCIAHVPAGTRTGKWHTAYCLASPHQTHKIFTLDHPILFFSPSSPTRIPGWPMSSLQGPQAFGKPYSELTGKQKSVVHEQADRVITQRIAEVLRSFTMK